MTDKLSKAKHIGVVPGATAARELCMLLRDTTAVRAIADQPDWWLEIKIDGIRALWAGDRWVTREGVAMDCCSHIVAAALYIEELVGAPIFLDCEYTAPGGFDDTISEFRTGRGTGIAVAFDFLPFAAWQTGKPDPDWPIERRKAVLEAVVKEVNSPFLQFLPAQKVSGIQGGRVIANICATGVEGVVLKRPGSLYTRGVSDDARRIKAVDTVDLTVIEVLPAANGKKASLLCLHADRRTIRVEGGTLSRDVADLINATRAAGGTVIIEASYFVRDRAKGQRMCFSRIRTDKSVP